MRTSRVDLSPLTRQRPFASVAAMDPGQRAEVSAEALARVHAAAPMDPCTFGCSVALRTTGAAIGQAGFQAPPSDGVIEIACGVDTAFPGRGFATAIAAALVAFALAGPGVQLTVTHTASDAGASGRVLTRCRFRLVGQVMDAGDGLVWRWEYARQAAPLIY